jgi:hypothetical protein
MFNFTEETLKSGGVLYRQPRHSHGVQAGCFEVESRLHLPLLNGQNKRTTVAVLVAQ